MPAEAALCVDPLPEVGRDRIEVQAEAIGGGGDGAALWNAVDPLFLFIPDVP